MSIQLTAQPSDYRGRTVDVLMFDDMAAHGDTKVLQALVKQGQAGAVITGIEKLIQRFLLELLTEVGSVAYRSHGGCTFMLDARAGRWRTAGDVANSFNLAMLQVRETLMLLEEIGDPDDERFSSAELLDVSVSADSAAITVMLTTAAGTSRTVYYPLRITYR